ncbi:MAG: hypothetical protein SFW08_00840 [Gemmatimonadaceae bacterium]|nr:hypothetical protein [Gemmatimonadaceae bacterium]
MALATLFDATDAARLLARFQSIPADRSPQWGRMTAPKMVVHCTEALRMATGELPVRMVPLGRVVQFSGLGPLLARRMPFPKSAPTHPKLLARAPSAYGDELAQLAAAFRAFASKPHTDRWAAHPLFGPLGARDWGILAARHLEHHLVQFGA